MISGVNIEIYKALPDLFSRSISYLELAGAAGALPGICEAVLLSAGAGAAAGATTAAPSKTLPDEAGRRLPK